MRRPAPTISCVAAFSTLSTVLTLAACADGGSTEWAGEVTDSAGVTMVSNPDVGLWGEGDVWTFQEEFRVGGFDAPIEAQFGQVLGVDLDVDGNLYVLDQQAGEVRVYDAAGQWLRTLGRSGSGPGELGPLVMGLFVVGGEVWVPDPGNARVTRFTLEGDLANSMPLDLGQGVPLRWDELAGDRVVAQFRSITAFQGQGGSTDDAIVTVGTETPDTLARLPQGGTISQAGLTFFASEPLWDAGPDGTLVSAMNDEYRIELRDGTGALRRVVRKAVTPREVTPADKDRLLDAIREMMARQTGAPPAALDQVLANASFADHYPAMSQLLVGPDGTLWVQQVLTAEQIAETGEVDLQDMGSSVWEIFDSEGRFLGATTFPDRFQPLRVIEDSFWGIQRDDLDVASVVGLRLVRGR